MKHLILVYENENSDGHGIVLRPALSIVDTIFWSRRIQELQEEKVFDVVWSDNRQVGKDGKVPAVGNTVDLEAANWTNTIGASELFTVWTDPDFDEDQQAFYYARVLEIPTPRWILYDRLRFGTELPENAVLTHQERAYTSPIWYAPED